MMTHYDAIILGFGKGGKTLAGKLAGDNKKVAIIEKSEKMYGGTCINVGCIPSKSLVKSALTAKGHKGASFEWKSEWYRKAIQEKRRVTSMLRKKNYDKLNDLENVTVYHGTAEFVSNTIVRIHAGEDIHDIEGEKIFINTGSTPVIPAIEGLTESHFIYTSETLMELENLPKRLVIVGGGYIGLEFASMYSNFGAQVTVLQDGEQFIRREDEDIAEAVKQVLEDKGIVFKLGCQIHRITDGETFGKVAVTWQGADEELEAEAILIAAGRKPNTDSLNAQAAGVRLTERGAVEVDEYRKTAVKNIWAMGDVAGDLQFTYVSLDDFRIVWSQLQGEDYNALKRHDVPYSVFIDPPFSRVGLNEKEATEAGYQVQVKKLPVAAIPKAQVLRHTEGMLKAVIDADTKRILGAMLFCEESYEMINIVKLAIDFGATEDVLQNQIFTHPTMSEALNDLFA